MEKLLDPGVLVFLVGIVAILVWGTVSIVRRAIEHQERLAMIERGLHPDRLGEEELSEAQQIEWPADKPRTKVP
jgi:hypothetical protein